jgi:hypothetical protein
LWDGFKDENKDSVLTRLAGADFFGNSESKFVNKLLCESV